MAQGQVSEGSASLEIMTTPESVLNQIEYGENYQFSVLIKNLNLDIEEDDFIDPNEREFRFSGNLILYISFTVSKKGIHHTLERNYERALLVWDTSKDIPLPVIGGSSVQLYDYNTTTMGYGSRVEVDEWVTFTIDAQLYVERYRESDGERRYYLGDPVAEQTHKYFVISASKVNYIGDVLDAVEEELTQAGATIADVEGQLGESLDVDLRDLEALKTAMNDAIEEGNYIKAMGLYEGFEPVWRDNLEEKLLSEAEAKQILESALEDANEQLEDLTQDFQTIEATLGNITASHQVEVQDLESNLSEAKTRGRLYIFGIVIALAGIVLVFLRSKRSRY
jgi:hypothetical protein